MDCIRWIIRDASPLPWGFFWPHTYTFPRVSVVRSKHNTQGLLYGISTRLCASFSSSASTSTGWWDRKPVKSFLILVSGFSLSFIVVEIVSWLSERVMQMPSHNNELDSYICVSSHSLWFSITSCSAKEDPKPTFLGFQIFPTHLYYL